MKRSKIILAALALSAAGAASAQDTASGGGNQVAAATTGAALYRDVCQACHMADGKGGVGAGMIPALAGNEKLGSAQYPAFVVLNGLGAMPAFKTSMTPKEVAEVVNYTRTHLGNRFEGPISEAEVKALAGD